MKKSVLVLAALLIITGLLAGCSQEDGEIKTYAVDPGDAFVTNVKDSKKLLKADITVEVLDEKTAALLEEKNYLVRDIVNNILRAKTEENLAASDAQKTLSDELTAALAQSLEIESISAVYFNTLVLQQ